MVSDLSVATNPPVPIDGQGDFGGQVGARIAAIQSIDATARLSGEISGLEVAVSVEISNNGTAVIGLDDVTVNMTGPGDTPASSVSTDPAAPLSGVLQPGESRSSVCVFTTATGDRNDVQVAVSSTAGSLPAPFSGIIPGG